ncbi:MAG: hypothetical protein ABIJ59_03165 [Pseudomonadota bacterium]
MITKLGITSLLAGFFVGLLAGISSFMATKNFWVNLTLSKIFGEAKTESIITWFDTLAIQSGLDFLFYTVPVFAVLMCLGVILLVISLFIKAK